MLRNYKERLGKCLLRVEITRLSILREISDISGFPSWLTTIFYLSSTSGLCCNQYTCCAGQSVHVSITKALSHCGHGHDLISGAQLSVVNIADIRSAFVETLASEHFHRIVVDGAP